MASFKAIIYQNHKKSDGSYKVKLDRYKCKIQHIATEIYVSKEDITKSLKIKKTIYFRYFLDTTIKKYPDICNFPDEWLHIVGVDHIIEHI
ncbi:MAG: hypothetical protein ACQPRJ_02480 [Solitalea-like symbiont of Acarus siro]